MALDPNWANRAACSPDRLAVDIPFFYGAPGYDERAAKYVCSRCPVAIECLDAAMREEAQWNGVYRFGIRGGLTATERTRLSLVDSRYAVYPDDLSEVEVLAIFTEVIENMRIQFVHPVDGFERKEQVDVAPEFAEHYLRGKHAVVIEPEIVDDEPEVEVQALPRSDNWASWSAFQTGA